MRGAAPIIDILSRILKLPIAYIVIQSYSGEGMEDQQGQLMFAREISSLANELMTILKSKRDEIVFKMKLTSKDEFEVLSKRVEILEKKIEKFNSQKKKKTKQVKRS